MAPNKMKQWTTALDGLDKLELGEVDMPTVRDGEVLVKIHAVSMNYRDTEGMPFPDGQHVTVTAHAPSPPSHS